MNGSTPKTLAELASSLKTMPKNSKILAGGTDLIIKLKNNTEVNHLVSIGLIQELKTIRLNQQNNCLEIGAAVTMQQLANYKQMPKALQALQMAAQDMGSAQIRNTATIGGNIAGASPAADLLPPLFLFQASVVTIDASAAIATKKIADIIAGAGKTTLRPDEAIIQIIIPLPQGNWQSSFQKLGNRSKVTIARINAAISCRQDDSGAIEACSLVLGAIAPQPVNITPSKILLGSHGEKVLSQKLAAAISEFILKNTPKEFDRDYKGKAIYGLIDDVVTHVMNDVVNDARKDVTADLT